MIVGTPQYAIVISGLGMTCNIFRYAFDIIMIATVRIASKSLKNERKIGDTNARHGFKKRKPHRENVGGGIQENENDESAENAPTLDNSPSPPFDGGSDDDGKETVVLLFLLPNAIHALLWVYFSIACALNSLTISPFDAAVYDKIPLGFSSGMTFLALGMSIRDVPRNRFNFFQRLLYVVSSVLSLVGAIMLVSIHPQPPETETSSVDYVTVLALSLYMAIAMYESFLNAYPVLQKKNDSPAKKVRLPRKTFMIMLRPYFWPDKTSDKNTAFRNRIYVILTWSCVVASKICNLVSPIYIGLASTALSRFEYRASIHKMLVFVLLQFSGNFFKEGQSVVYLRVAQAAFIQLSEISFEHLHCLSLDWHFRKKLGEVIRSMDRGISACDNLMKQLCLFLIPGIVEAVLVCVILATYFDNLGIAAALFYFVFMFFFATILITLWRKKHRKKAAKSDNDWHDICTDSLINFEMVKYFAAEDYEKRRFSDAVRDYQSAGVKVAALHSLLKTLQMFLTQACLATTLSLSVMSIKSRVDCCVDEHGCSDGNSSCCADISKDTCPGMEIGDFVAVLTYTLNLFTPLNFLGKIYNSIVMSIVDLINLSELLAEKPDVVDSIDAIPLPINNVDSNISVEFDNVHFHYPQQPESNGLRGLSFQMEKGKITAIVGPTGAGKTTVSRLLFRFYDVVEGSISIHGVPINSVTLHSLRETIGVVPQTSTMFNDTIRANIRYGKRDAEQSELDKVAKDSQLDSFIYSLQDGWDTLVGDRGLKLSGGERQRAAIARCLLKNPPLVVLDEATSALDTLTENSVQEALNCLAGERTCLVIAHRLGTIRNADKIVVLNEGRAVEQGTHEELLKIDGKYAEMWNMQLHQNKATVE